jgi:hypothetical protein
MCSACARSSHPQKEQQVCLEWDRRDVQLVTLTAEGASERGLPTGFAHVKYRGARRGRL